MRINLHSPQHFSKTIRSCDKTVSIIPSVLIENAVKYSVPGTPVDIFFEEKDGYCIVRVKNTARGNFSLGRDVFESGVRHSDIEGTGNGLYLCRLVVEQHRGTIEVDTEPGSPDTTECTFTIRIPKESNIR